MATRQEVEDALGEIEERHSGAGALVLEVGDGYKTTVCASRDPHPDAKERCGVVALLGDFEVRGDARERESG